MLAQMERRFVAISTFGWRIWVEILSIY